MKYIGMRLLRKAPTTPSTYIVDSFSNRDIPSYAILSHTWGDDEITLADLDSPLPNLVNSSGYRKLESSCKIAHDGGFTYIWIDTCCIDKSSSAELSEVLNSMYAYYRDSVVCYVYLSDVSPGLDPRASGEGSFRKSRWFTRGWTLQELLASPRILFYDRDWNRIGTKSSLRDVIVEVTNVPAAVLLGHTDIQSVSIALRMSWAATRVTTRPEDVAYCLMVSSEYICHLFMVKEREGRSFVCRRRFSSITMIQQSLFGKRQIPPAELERPAPTEERSSLSSDELTNRGVRIALYLRPITASESYSKLLVVTILTTGISSVMIVHLADFLEQYHYLAQRCMGSHTATFDTRQEIGYNTLAIRLIVIALMDTIPNTSLANCCCIMAFVLSTWCTTVSQRSILYTYYTSLRHLYRNGAPNVHEEVLYALLPCWDANGRPIAIFLQKTTESRDYLRLNPDQLVVDDAALHRGWRRDLFKKSEIFVKEEVFKESEVPKTRQWRWKLLLSRHLRIVDSFPVQMYDLSQMQSISDPEAARTSAVTTIDQKAGPSMDDSYLAEPAIVDVSCIQLPLATLCDTLVIKLEKREGNNDQFAIAIGQSELAVGPRMGQIWVDIIPEVKENLTEIHKSYKHPHKRADMIARGVDEVSRQLKNGAVSVTTNYIQPVPCSRQSIVGFHKDPELSESNAPCCEVSVNTDEDEAYVLIPAPPLSTSS
ncbi:hypothetical protein D9758_010001 [Tetrapyrgos nigripes]|uniref:Heterokaryon incompatibility domain-containing protein n=1 Tax=Tetrapyrgos nigripes TaxID=182062 RepID=A0A8H5CVW7_9AGAR|nr:hypothetical protein D9758_010001 [Tetrapyrgos nigripes]